MEGRKILVIAVSLIALGALITAGIYHRNHAPIIEEKALSPIEIKGKPTIGNPLAKVHIVVFEDFRCPHCAEFSEKVFPKIKDAYIDTGKAQYTMIPVAFLPGSKPIANAALEVYATTPDLFFPYADELFASNPTTKKELLYLASNIKGIQLESLEACMKTDCHYQVLDQNLREIKKVMGNNYSTPAVYINGELTPANFHSVRARVEQILERDL